MQAVMNYQMWRFKVLPDMVLTFVKFYITLYFLEFYIDTHHFLFVLNTLTWLQQDEMGKFSGLNFPIMLSVLDGLMLGMFLKAFQRSHRALLS